MVNLSDCESVKVSAAAVMSDATLKSLQPLSQTILELDSLGSGYSQPVPLVPVLCSLPVNWDFFPPTRAPNWAVFLNFFFPFSIIMTHCSGKIAAKLTDSVIDPSITCCVFVLGAASTSASCSHLMRMSENCLTIEKILTSLLCLTAALMPCLISSLWTEFKALKGVLKKVLILFKTCYCWVRDDLMVESFLHIHVSVDIFIVGTQKV